MGWGSRKKGPTPEEVDAALDRQNQWDVARGRREAARNRQYVEDNGLADYAARTRYFDLYNDREL